MSDNTIHYPLLKAIKLFTRSFIGKKAYNEKNP